MLGAIIGDLAASQWYIDKDRFYLELVTAKSCLSDYGVAALEIAGYLCGGGILDEDFAHKYSFKYPVRDWEVCRSLITVVSGCFASTYDEEDVVRNLNQSYLSMIDFEKEDLYATNIVWRVVLSLRKGATKKEASDPQMGSFLNALADWDTHKVGVLADVVRAWRCFYYAYDFNSTIHNAVKCMHPHITSIIAGMFAEAMYGCQYGLTKKKFGEHHSIRITLPESVLDKYKSQLSKIVKSDNAKLLFWKKNMSATNVEKHDWKDCIIPSVNLSVKDVDRIRLAKVADVEKDYGFYWDDGWFYCYRSNVVLLRFQLDDGSCLRSLQLSGEMGASVSLMGLVYALKFTYEVKGAETLESYVHGLSFCHYFHGETDPSGFWSDDEKCFHWIEKNYYYYCFIDPEQRRHWEYDALSIWDDKDILPYINCDKIPIEVKGMLSFTIQDFLYHSPGSEAVVYRYARKIGEFYHMENLPDIKH